VFDPLRVRPESFISLPVVPLKKATLLLTAEAGPETPFNATEASASNLTVPAVFLKYSFSSVVLIANSPATKFVLTGTADAVVVRYREMGVKPVAAMFVP